MSRTKDATVCSYPPLPHTAGTAPQIIGRPLVWITSPPVRATAGEVVEVSGWVRVQQRIAGSIDGLEIIDSLGGQELALRLDDTADWQPFRMIRSVADTTDFTVTFALNGVGVACVDSVMVRTLADTDREAVADGHQPARAQVSELPPADRCSLRRGRDRLARACRVLLPNFVPTPSRFGGPASRRCCPSG